MEERSYGGRILRPTPEIHIEADGSFGVIVTPWGSRAGVKRIIETLSDFILSAKNDMEATSPFQMLTCVSPLTNTLRAAIMLTNDTIYREENKGEYQSGVELFVFARSQSELVFSQIGHPHAMLKRNGQILPLAISVDASLEWSGAQKLPPLPKTLLGLHNTSNFLVQSIRPRAGDELILLSRSQLGSKLLQMPTSSMTLDNMTKTLSSEDPEQPFWIGLYPLPEWPDSKEDAA